MSDFDYGRYFGPILPLADACDYALKRQAATQTAPAPEFPALNTPPRRPRAARIVNAQFTFLTEA